MTRLHFYKHLFYYKPFKLLVSTIEHYNIARCMIRAISKISEQMTHSVTHTPHTYTYIIQQTYKKVPLVSIK